MMQRFAVMALALALLSTPALAGNFYLGAHYGQGSFEAQGFGARVSLDDSGYKAYAGYRFMKFVGAELAYTDLGSLHEFDTGSGLTVDADGNLLSLQVLGIFPVGERLEFFGMLGVSDWSISEHIAAGMILLDLDLDGTDLTYGAGIAFRVTDHVVIRGEFENHDIAEVDNVKFGSIGVRIDF